ncbi:21087_t:CDS:1, partial [Dentiscutata erythropus]
SINFVHDAVSWEMVQSIQKHFQRDIVKVPTDDWDTVEKILRKEVNV